MISTYKVVVKFYFVPVHKALLSDVLKSDDSDVSAVPGGDGDGKADLFGCSRCRRMHRRCGDRHLLNFDFVFS